MLFEIREFKNVSEVSTDKLYKLLHVAQDNFIDLKEELDHTSKRIASIKDELNSRGKRA